MLVRMFIVMGIWIMAIGLNGQNADPVLMRVGSTDVKVSEFKYIYEKNNGTNADYSEKNLMEYLDLYTKFKLKVEKAKQMRLDTITDLITELDGYRKQLASSYLIDKEVTDFLLQELYGRMKEDVEFSHIFVPVSESSTKAIKDDAKNKLREIKSKIVGGLSFEDAAKDFSLDKTTATKGGYMGFFTAKLPSGFYELETALYTTVIGQVSDIVESRIGYHLIKVISKRPARGVLEVAHILFRQDQKRLADSVYMALQNGGNFDDMVAKYSDDKSTSKNSGKLAPFGINTYDKTFEDAAYSLKNNSDISKPVFTKAGWHIIKRINKQEPDKYELFVRKMKSQINKDQRFDAAKLKLISDIKKAAGFKEDKSELLRFTSGLNDDFYSYKWSPDSSVSTKLLFSLGGANIYTVADFAIFCKKNTKTRLKYDKTKPLGEAIEDLYTEYVNETAMAYEEKSLEMKYPDFKSLMREYEEGILLFEATKIHVWDKANQDSTGLSSFYDSHKNNYKWEEKILLSDFKIMDANKKLVDKIYAFAAKNDSEKVIKKFNKKKEIVVITDTEHEKGSKDILNIEWRKGWFSPLSQDPKNNTYSFKMVKELIPPKNKSLSEARGYVVADYQDFLEKEWIKTLSMEYNVVIFPETLNQLKN